MFFGAFYNIRFKKKINFGLLKEAQILITYFNETSSMNFPKELKYTKDHEWVRVEGKEAYVGITDFAQGELGDIVYIDISSQGDALDKEEVFGSVEAVKTVSDLYMPISGTILEVNPALENEPELVNTDPYGKGWMIKIAISNESEISSLMDADTYQSSINH